MKDSKFCINDIKSKLSRSQMRDILGGSMFIKRGAFPDALCEVVCSDERIIGTNQCPASDTHICGGYKILSCTCK